MTSARLIVFSETGFTRTYAQWIADETGLVAEDLAKDSPAKIQGCDLLIVGAPVHGSELAQSKLVCRTVDAAAEAGAHVIVFATGVTPPSAGYAERVRRESGLADCPVSFYFLPGGFDRDRLTQASKTLIGLYRLMMRRQHRNEEETEILLQRTERRCDLTDRDLVAPLVMEAKSCMTVGRRDERN